MLPRDLGLIADTGQTGAIDQVRAVVDNLRLCSHLAKVGYAKTLIIQSWVTTHQQLPDEDKIWGDVTPDLIRVSTGMEDTEAIIFDFEQALIATDLKERARSRVRWETLQMISWATGRLALQGLAPMASSYRIMMNARTDRA